MSRHKRLFTSESVTEGHPDKVADQISDAILDAIMTQDPHGRVAVETFVITGQVHVAGEISTSCYIEIPRIVRQVLRDIGYTRAKYGFDADTCGISVSIDEQSQDIAMGVDRALEVKEGEISAKTELEALGAGDQGMMFGFACRETKELMPLPIVLAHRLTRTLAAARKNKVIDYLRPDGKTQVTVEYDGHKPVRVDAIVVSAQHADGYPIDVIRENIISHVIDTAIDGHLRDKDTRIFVNPTGRFVIGGPQGDCGLTGRKIIVDTYGGACPHGGGAFSGKDPTKVDRSAAYAARYLAKNVVAAGLADRCTLQVSYAIGVSQPLSIYVDLHGTGRIEEERLETAIGSVMDLSPRGIRQHLRLNRPIYARTSAYGHFGRAPETDGGFSWERVDLAEAMREAVG